MVAFKVFKVEMDPWLLKAFPATYKKHIKSLHITNGLWRIRDSFLSEQQNVIALKLNILARCLILVRVTNYI